MAALRTFFCKAADPDISVSSACAAAIAPRAYAANVIPLVGLPLKTGRVFSFCSLSFSPEPLGTTVENAVRSEFFANGFRNIDERFEITIFVKVI